MTVKKRYEDDEDDGRTIVNMNVDGMPWYRRESADGKGFFAGNKGGVQMSEEEYKAYRLAAVKASVLLVLAFGLIFFLFIAFIDFIWFGNI